MVHQFAPSHGSPDPRNNWRATSPAQSVHDLGEEHLADARSVGPAKRWDVMMTSRVVSRSSSMLLF